MKLLIYPFFFLLSFSMCVAQAAPASGQSKVSDADQTPSETPKKKKIGVDQSDFMPAANSFGLIFSYGVSYNNLQQIEQKTYRHRLSLAGTYSFNKHWSAYGAVGASHRSTGEKIVKSNDADDFHEVSNLNFGAVYSKMKPLSFVRRSSNTVNVGLPVSRRSRTDKHIGNISLTNFMQSYSWKNFFLFNRLTANFLWNSQRFSLYSDDFFRGDTLNRDWLVSDSFGLTYMILPRLGARFNYRVDMVRYLDGSWEQSFGNNLSIFANVSGIQIFASMINNSYEENERVDLGFYDKYRRIFLGGATYAF